MRYFVFAVALGICPFAAWSQENTKPSHVWLFNDGSVKNRGQVRFYGIEPADDRFGNPDKALYFDGNQRSYVNLGPNSQLNTEKGSVSLWFSIHGIMGTGKGVDSNPIFCSRSHQTEHCNDAVYMGIDMNTRKLNGATMLDSLHYHTVYARQQINMNQWYHAVLTYNDDSLALYLDGKLMQHKEKGFRTAFLAGDSIILGVRNRGKNQRYFLGAIDDVMFFDYVLNPSEVKALYEDPNPDRRAVVLRYVLMTLAVGILILAIVLLIRQRVKSLVSARMRQISLENKVHEQEIRILKAQMNPHFIFNAMNTVQQFILSKDNDLAEQYLARFARLIRQLLESNTSDQVSLQNEVTILKQYLEMESIRFGNVFSYSLTVQDGLDLDRIMIPHFLVQPFVENAIWHGLLPKKGTKRLNVSFERYNENALRCTVEDNGIGRKKAGNLNSVKKDKSYGIEFTRSRLEMIGKLRNRRFDLDIIDLDDSETGTRVKIDLPLTEI